jgi:hypothetical protein
MMCAYYFTLISSVACDHRVTIFVPDALMLLELMWIYPQF